MVYRVRSLRDAGIIVLLVAALGILAAFQMWPVMAVVLLLLGGLAIHESSERLRLQELEARISVVQVSGKERIDRLCKILDDVSDVISLFRLELKQVAGNLEGRVAAIEQRFQSERIDTQKFYDLVQKVIEVENRVSAISAKQKGEGGSDF